MEIINKLYARVIPPQAWIKETETELSDSEVLTLPGGIEPVTPKSLVCHGPLGFQGSYPGSRRTQKIGRRRHGVCPEHFVPWVLTPVMGKFGVMVKGRCHIFYRLFLGTVSLH